MRCVAPEVSARAVATVDPTACVTDDVETDGVDTEGVETEGVETDGVETDGTLTDLGAFGRPKAGLTEASRPAVACNKSVNAMPSCTQRRTRLRRRVVEQLRDGTSRSCGRRINSIHVHNAVGSQILRRPERLRGSGSGR